MKRKSPIVSIVIFFLLIFVGFIIVVICPADKTSAEKENRNLAVMPEFNKETVLSGKFTKEFEDFLTDNVGFRSIFIDWNMYYDDGKGVSYFGDLVRVRKDLGMESSEDEEEDGEMKSLLVLDDRILEIFEKNDKARKDYIDAVNFYAKKLPSKIKLYNMIIPTQIEFTNAWYSAASDSQKETIDYIYENLDKRVKTINAYDILKEHKDEYIYFRTDHHWTALGAYYAANAFFEQTGQRTVNINNYIANDIEGFFGFLYSQAGTKKLAKKPDTLTYYTKFPNENLQINAKGYQNGEKVNYFCNMYDLPENEAPKYKVFLTGDHTFLDISTGVKSGKSILVIKDSYANAFIPWLRSVYEHIYVIDPRTYGDKLDELFDEYKIDEVMIFNYSLTTTFDDFNEMLKDIYK